MDLILYYTVRETSNKAVINQESREWIGEKMFFLVKTCIRAQSPPSAIK